VSKPNDKGNKKTKKGGRLSQAAKELGAEGGRIGGPSRAKSLSAAERSKIASEGGKAAAAT
jgi:hypothetical protein